MPEPTDSYKEKSPPNHAFESRRRWLERIEVTLTPFVRDAGTSELRIGVVGALGTGDVGDEAMLVSLLDELRSIYPAAEFRVFSLNPALTESYVHIPCRPTAHGWMTPRENVWAAITTLLTVLESKFTLMMPRLRRQDEVNREQWLARWIFLALHRRTRNLAARVGKSNNMPTTGHLATHVQDIAGLDALIYLGGGYINSWHVKAASYLYLISAVAAAELGIPVIGTGMNLGPLNRFDHKRTGRILQRFALIGLRDRSESIDALKTMGIYDVGKHHYSCDDALGLTPKATRELERWVENVGPFVSLHAHYWRLTSDQWERFASTLAQAIDSLLAETSARIVMIPMLFDSERQQFDARALREIAGRCRHSERMIMAPDELGPQQLRYLYGRAEHAIVCRHHSMVFSLAGGVPTTGLYFDDYYRQKLRGVAEPFGDLCTLLDAAACTSEQIFRSSLRRR